MNDRDMFKNSLPYGQLKKELLQVESFAVFAIHKGYGIGDLEDVEAENVLHCTKIMKKVLAELKNHNETDGQAIAKDALAKNCEWFNLDWQNLVSRSNNIGVEQTALFNNAGSM